jgi:antitoxin HicB
MLESRTMADIARTMGVAYQSYQRIESGKNLTMKSLKKAALALGSIVEIRLRRIPQRIYR